MRRDYIAISLYAYLAIVLSAPTFGLVPLSGPLRDEPHFLAIVTSAATWIGCVLGFAGRWWRDELDGRAVEQFGLALGIVGWLLYLYAFGTLLPREGWLGMFLCGGFMVAFVAQWWAIRKWRRQLRRLAGGDAV